jgi:hypothetical protein
MSSLVLEQLLTAARDTLDSIRLVSSIRGVVHSHVPDYEQCIDVSLSQQFELLSALMSQYMSFRRHDDYETEEVGNEPLSYSEALELLDRFAVESRNSITNSLAESTFLYRAMEISVRAQTFAGLLRSKENANEKR